MGILSGFIEKDAGSMTLNGEPYEPQSPLEARAAGVEIVHQHFMLVPSFTVAENLTLSCLSRERWQLNPSQAAKIGLDLAQSLDWELNPDAIVANLPVGQRQRLEIIKAIANQGQILILDEPTAVLSEQEVSDLFGVLRQLRSSGATIILIAHKLSEIFQIADRVTVLRQGRLIGSAAIGEVDQESLAQWMVGELPVGLSKEARRAGDVVVSAKNIVILGDQGNQAVTGVTFDVRAGEVLGFGGVDDNGQVELAESLAGIRPIQAGSLYAETSAVYIPQDRQRDGLALDMSVLENLLVTGHSNLDMRAGPFLNLARLKAWGENLVHRYQIKVQSLKQEAGSLSGGNQQKVVIARSMARAPKFLVAVNPTRGLDVHASAFVHNQLLAARNAGAAIALFSNDLDELALLADRTLFMSRGQISDSADASALVGGG